MTLDDLGLTKGLYKIGSEIPTASLSSEVQSEDIESGEISGNLVINKGFLQSKNYISGSSGWSVKDDGTAEFASITLTGGTFKYGKTSFTDSTHAGYYFGSEGMYIGSASDTTKLKYTIADGSFNLVGTVSGRSTATLASAIDSSGHFVDANLNTSAKTILDSFTFGASGAIQIGTYVNGASGDVRITPNGIIGRDSTGANTFTLDATTGAITSFVLTAGTITGVTLQTATSGKRLVLSGSTFQGYNSSNNGTLTLGGNSAQIYSYADGALPAAIFFSNDNSTTADVVQIDAGETSGIALKITGTGNTNNNLVTIESNGGAKNLLYIANDSNTGYSLARFFQNDLDKTGILVSQDSSDTPANTGIVEIKDYTGGLDCLCLNNAHGHAHILFSGGGTYLGTPTSVLDSYSESNKNGDIYLSSVEKLAVSQSFTAGATKNIGKITLYLRKLGNPTGNITVQIYAHSGTYGTNSVPTGAVLATSDNVDISGLTTSYALYDFNFSGAERISLTSGTKYVFVVRYTGGDVVNDLYVGTDSSSPTHGGNWANSTDGTTFDADNLRDICFYVYGLTPADGEMWYDGTHLYFQKGASTITLT